MEKRIIELFSTDNSYFIIVTVIVFFLFFGMSENIFVHLFGCNLKFLFKLKIIRHLLGIIILFLIFDSGFNDNIINPIFSLLFSIISYVLLYILSHMNTIYISFVCILLFCILVITKIKNFFEVTITDQEILKERQDFLYKFTNVLVIIAILAIIIGFFTGTNKKNLIHGIFNINTCKK